MPSIFPHERLDVYQRYLSVTDKPGIIAKDGVLYHFYCAVAPARDKHQGEIVHGEVRGISLATNEQV